MIKFLSAALFLIPTIAFAQNVNEGQAKANADATANATRTASQVGVATPNVLFSSLASQADNCSTINSASFGALDFAVNLNFTRNDNNCQIIRDSKQALILGKVFTAIQLMCLLPNYRAAAKAANEPCEEQHK